MARDGSRVTFLRSSGGDDPRTSLWVFDVAERRERLVVDAADLGGTASAEAVSVEERARRERTRETAEGIVAYATDREALIAAFVQSGRLFVADLVGGGARELDVPTPVFDPRPDPSGRLVAFVHERALYVVRLDDGRHTRLTREESAAVGWGMAEFVAAEEMDRRRGYWWAPGGQALLAARVDEASVPEVWIADPADPAAPPRPVRYPLAGAPNASVGVYVLGLDGAAPARIEVKWDTATFPYLAVADWDDHGPLLAVQSRDQRRLVVLAVDPVTGLTAELGTQVDDAWTDLVPGVPRRLPDGPLVTVAVVGDALSLLVDGRSVTPPDLEVREVVAVGEGEVVFTASRVPIETHVWRWGAADGLSALTTTAGVHTAAGPGRVQVIGSSTMERDGRCWWLGDHTFGSRAERSIVEPSVRLLTVGPRRLRAGLVLPRDHESGRALPVLMDPYGGPHFQRVVAERHRWLESQWLADQGFAVIVVDGRGTSGRGAAWARAVSGDLATPVLEDQIDALHEVAALEPDLDLSRVAIRGWSFGGYLAALAVLRRPETFHAAVAGAPVTEWRLYDTHYTERYLGCDPEGADRLAYERSSLLTDGPTLRRPLLLVHGFADDNVLVAHTLQLSQRLTESGRPHTVVPLSGITHMTTQEAVAENLLTLEVEFLLQALSAHGVARRRSE